MGAGSDHEDPDGAGHPALGPWCPLIGELSDAEDKAVTQVSTLSSAVTVSDPRPASLTPATSLASSAGAVHLSSVVTRAGT